MARLLNIVNRGSVPQLGDFATRKCWRSRRFGRAVSALGAIDFVGKSSGGSQRKADIRTVASATPFPRPPKQTEKWDVSNSKLPHNAISAIKTLFQQGLGDPRGCEYREIEIRVGNCWNGGGDVVETHGWVFPADDETAKRFGLAWNGLVYPLISVGELADVAKDAKAGLKAAPANNSRLSGAPAEQTAVSHLSVLPLKAAMLLRLGETDLAEQQWAAARKLQLNSSEDDPYLVLARDWTWYLFDRASCTHMRADDEIAPQDSPSNAGTLGGLVFSNSKTRLITNQHVAGDVDSLVQQPASGITSNGKLAVIGKVVAAEMPGRGEIGSIDCALIDPNRDRSLRKRIKDLGPPFRFASGVLTQPDVHRTVATKVGAFTGRTSGIVKSVNTVVEVNGATMPKQIIVESEDNSVIIEAGDSGSLLVVKAGSESDDNAVFNIVGLVHARSKDGTAIVATHFHEIETRFGVKATRF